MSKMMTRRQWNTRRRRVRQHLEWSRECEVFVGTGWAGIALLLPAGAVAWWAVLKGGWAGASGEFASVMLLGWGCMVVRTTYYKRWIAWQMTGLSYTAGEEMVSHRWFGIDEVTARLINLIQQRPENEVRLFSYKGNPKKVSDLRWLLSAVLGEGEAGHALAGPTIDEAKSLIRSTEKFFDDLNTLVRVVPLLCDAQEKAELTVLLECEAVLLRCEDESERRMLVEMAERCQTKGKSVREVLAMIEQCVALVKS